MTVGLRPSLLVRMGFALAVLGFVALVAVAALAATGVLVGVVLAAVGGPFVAVLDAAPRLSSHLPVGPTAVAAAALVAHAVQAYGLPTVARVTGVSAEDVEIFLGLVLSLATIYLFPVEGLAAARVHAPENDELLFFTASCALILVFGTVAEIREEIREFRAGLLDDTVPADEEHAAVAETTSRLAQQAALPVPEVRVSETDRPESFTVGRGANAVVVVSSGLLETLPPAELEAVLAHEVSHLANADGAVMSAALTPVLLADNEIEDDSGLVWNVAFTVLKWHGQLGVAVLSVGREWAADDAAVALTGSPVALAAALERLDEGRARPSEDRREWERTVAALDILPTEADAVGTGPFDTHPPTERRVERLRDLAARAERE